MKKLIIVSSILAALVGCSTTSDPYQKRAEVEQEKREKNAERALDKAPKWMTELPKSTGAVYANGTAVSGDFSMADEKAKTIAFGKICMAAGGEVDKQSRVFISDVGDTTTENSETAIRSMCRKVDVTGAEITEIKRITENGRFRSYVLVALPIGDANVLRKTKVQDELYKNTANRATAAFKELDKQ
jgi:hypothetical protein